ncbi:11067_t:CDS:2, partial [Scutellospora calospora]
YPKDIYIPKNFSIPPENVFKFVVYTGGIFWYTCTNDGWTSGFATDYRDLYFNNEEDLAKYPSSPVAAVYLEGIVRSLIPKYDTSTISLNQLCVAPSLDPKKNYENKLFKITGTKGKGAFSDITYLMLLNTKGGVTPDAQ